MGNHIRLFDFTEKFPNYEVALISSIRSTVRSDDQVVIVGGGMGVSSVAAAEATGRNGRILTFEASKSQYRAIHDTIDLNMVSDCVELRHAVVGPISDFSEDLYGPTENAEKISPSQLPECDVLALDCEGAERDILQNMSISPTSIIVETHSFLGTSASEIEEILNEKGYTIRSRLTEDESKGIYVLTAEK